MIEALKTLAIHTGEEDIKRLLAENNITIEPPTPPDDLAILAVKDARHRYVWLVMRFFKPGDDGYLAYGLPESTPMQIIQEVFQMILSKYDGMPAAVVTLPPLSFN